MFFWNTNKLKIRIIPIDEMTMAVHLTTFEVFLPKIEKFQSDEQMIIVVRVNIEKKTLCLKSGKNEMITEEPSSPKSLRFVNGVP